MLVHCRLWKQEIRALWNSARFLEFSSYMLERSVKIQKYSKNKQMLKKKRTIHHYLEERV